MTLITSLLLSAWLSPILAQAQDTLYYYDRVKGAKATRKGTVVEESPLRVTITYTNLGMQNKLDVLIQDVEDVTYGQEPAEMERARSLEKAGRWREALTIYQGVVQKVAAEDKFLFGYVNFKEARAMVGVAELENATPGERVDAAGKLRKFIKDFPESRFQLNALQVLGQLLLREGRPLEDVIQGYQSVRSRFGTANPDLATRCDFQQSQLLLLQAQMHQTKRDTTKAGESYKEAMPKLTALLAKADKQTKIDIKLSLAECHAGTGNKAEALKTLEEVQTEATDDRVRGMVHLARGDVYRLNQQPRDAMWEYLWVDVLYNAEREHSAKALYHLYEIFKTAGDNTKAEACEARLRNEFGQSRFARMLPPKK